MKYLKRNQRILNIINKKLIVTKDKKKKLETSNINKRKIYAFINLSKALTSWACFCLVINVSLAVKLAIAGAILIKKKVATSFLGLSL